MKGSVRRWAATGVMAGSYALAGCKSRTSLGKPFDPATLGSVAGVVRFAGKVPAPVKLDTTMDPGCSLSGKDAYSEQYEVSDGKLANVYIYVKSIKAAPGMGFVFGGGHSGPGAIIDQKGCVYIPHVAAIEAGDAIEVDNHDPTMHNIHTMPILAGNQPVDTSQGPKGKPQVLHFDKPETMIPLRCSVHPWMEAFINVSPTEWFAVTGPEGSFRLKGMPPGEYTIGAVQEKMGEQDLTVTVKPQSETKADFTFTMQ